MHGEEGARFAGARGIEARVPLERFDDERSAAVLVAERDADRACVIEEPRVLGPVSESALARVFGLGETSVAIEGPGSRVVGVDAAAGLRFFQAERQRFGSVLAVARPERRDRPAIVA